MSAPRRKVVRWNLQQRPGQRLLWWAQLSCTHEDWWRAPLSNLPASLSDKPPKTIGCTTCAKLAKQQSTAGVTTVATKHKLEPTTVTAVAPRHNDKYKVLEFTHGAASDGGVAVEVYILNPGDWFEGFGGSRHGLVTRKTASLIIRTKHRAWGFRDVEYDVNDKEAWKAIAEGIKLSYESVT